MFRIVLEPTFTDSLEEVKVEANDIVNMFNLQVEHMQAKKMLMSDLSARQMYIIQTPVRLYIWIGSEVNRIKRMSCLRIMQSFA